MKKPSLSLVPEFSRPCPADRVPAHGIEQTVTASPDERKKLAARFELLEINELKAVLQLQPGRNGDVIEVTGPMTAQVVYRCVITLEPLPASIVQDIQAVIVLDPKAIDEAEAMAPDAPETELVENGVIDLGELVAQQLGVTLDPYPRKPGAVVENLVASAPIEVVKPFATLVNLVKKDDQ
jgi:uncharacterized metal-binding protein YceD (DUF177 family)